MISPEMRIVAQSIRTSLSLDREWQMMNSMPAPHPSISMVVAAPESYVETLTIADGFICGPVVMFDAKTFPAMQFYADTPDAPNVQINREEWFCAGVVSDEPWFIERSDESIWTFPDTGVAWWMSERFERKASSLERFFLDTICGPDYLTLTGAQEGDQWWRLLMRIGRI